MLAEWRESRFRIEISLLLALCFFLPLLEAPKNLAWLAYLFTWLANRIRARDFGGRWDAWDTLIAIWITSGFVVAAAAQTGEIRDGEWRGAIDLMRYASIAWLVKRARYTERELTWVLGTLVLSTLLGLAVGYMRMWTGIGKSGTLQLHSVGHVNHTAVYLAIVMGAWGAWFFASYRTWTTRLRTLGAAIFVLLLVSLAVTASRAALGAGLAFLFALAFAFRRRWRAPMTVVLASTAILVAGAVLFGAELVRKQQRYEAESNPLSHRDSIWRMGLAGWERHPWLGVGMGNYAQINPERVKAWRAEAGKDYDPARFMHFPHAHSLYINTLAERGVLGFAALLAVLAAWAAALLRGLPSSAAPESDWTFWGASASGLFVTLTAGLLNTTLHNEHGILAALLLGLWLGRPKTRAAS